MTRLHCAALAVVLGACGSTGNEGEAPPPPPTLSAGAYHVSNVSFSEDRCLLANLPDPLTIDIRNNADITFTDLGQNNVPSGSFQGRDFVARADYVYDNRQDEPPVDCSEHIIKEVYGHISATDEFQGRFHYESNVANGNQCTAEALGYPVPCASEATFVGTRMR